MDIIGLDLSLTSTGLACGHCGVVTTIVPKKARGAERLQRLREGVMTHAEHNHLAVIEAYGYLKAAAMAIPEVHGVVKVALYENDIRYALVPPTVLKKFTTGKGNVKKDEMLLAATRRWSFEGANNDECDAWMLQMMGTAAYADVEGQVPQYAMEALTKVEWPEMREFFDAT